MHAFWQKYGLIVVGNLVFFALLYFMQYQPNSRDSRATVGYARHRELLFRAPAVDPTQSLNVQPASSVSAPRIAILSA